MSVDDSSDKFPESDGFSDLIIQEQDYLYALSRVLGVPRSDVPDVLQDANLYMVENQSKFVPGTNFRAWASQVLRYRILHYFRRNKRRNTCPLNEEALKAVIFEISDEYDTLEPRLQKLRYCLERLTAHQFQLLSSFYGHGKSLKQIAKEGGYSHVALRKTISRLRMMLKQCIEGLNQD